MSEEKAPKSPEAEEAQKTQNKKESKKNNNQKVPFDDGCYVELNEKKFVRKSEFKKNVYIDIREYYEKDGKLLPGKKGISLKKEEFKEFIDHLEEIKGWLE